MGNGSIWEVRSLRLMLAINFLILSYLTVDNFFSRTYQTWLENTLLFLFPTVAVIYGVYLMLHLNRTNYPIHLLIVIITSHLTLNGIFIGEEWATLQLSPEERLGVGRAMDFSFNSFYPIAICALFFQRLWAVVLWLALSLFTPLKNVFLILSHPLTYFTGDWPLLLRDGYAISSWMLQGNITVSVFLLPCFWESLFSTVMFCAQLLVSRKQMRHWVVTSHQISKMKSKMRIQCLPIKSQKICRSQSCLLTLYLSPKHLN